MTFLICYFDGAGTGCLLSCYLNKTLTIEMTQANVYRRYGLRTIKKYTLFLHRL